MKVHVLPPLTVLPLARPDYEAIVSEWNSVNNNNGRAMADPAVIVSLPLVIPRW